MRGNRHHQGQIIIVNEFKSKCKTVECCGILKCERDIEHEVELDEREPPSPRAEDTNSQRV